MMTIYTFQLQAMESIDVMAGDKLITIEVLTDGTVNIFTPDGGHTKIWPDKIPEPELDTESE